MCQLTKIMVAIQPDHTNFQLSGLDMLGSFSTILYKGDNFYDFQLPSVTSHF